MVFDNDNLKNTGPRSESGATTQSMSCLAGCGFFGSAQFRGYCSQCYVLCEIAQLSADEERMSNHHHNTEINATTTTADIDNNSNNNDINNSNIGEDDAIACKDRAQIVGLGVGDEEIGLKHISEDMTTNASIDEDRAGILMEMVNEGTILDGDVKMTDQYDPRPNSDTLLFSISSSQMNNNLHQPAEVSEVKQTTCVTHLPAVENNSFKLSIANPDVDANTKPVEVIMVDGCLQSSTSVAAAADNSTICTSQTILPTPAPLQKQQQPKGKQTRCQKCKSKLKLTDLECVCGNRYCWKHQFSESHECTYDFKSKQQQKLSKDITKVAPKNIKDF